jgi:hypothetical protein
LITVPSRYLDLCWIIKDSDFTYRPIVNWSIALPRTHGRCLHKTFLKRGKEGSGKRLVGNVLAHVVLSSEYLITQIHVE